MRGDDEKEQIPYLRVGMTIRVIPRVDYSS